MPAENEQKKNDGKSTKEGKSKAGSIVEMITSSVTQYSAKQIEIQNKNNNTYGTCKSIAEGLLVTSIASKCVNDGTAKKSLEEQKAIYGAFIENTILSDTYMNAVTNKLANNIDEAIEKATTDKMKSLTGGAFSAVDNTLSGVSNKLGSLSTSISNFTDPLIKFDIQNSVVSALSSVRIGQSITGVLNSNPITSWLAGPIGAVVDGVTQGITINIASGPLGQEVVKIQTQILQQVAMVQNAVAAIQAEMLKVRMAVEAFKNRIYMAATAFVQSIIAPIKEAVVNAVKGIMSGVASAIKDSISGLFAKSDKKDNAIETPASGEDSASQEGGAAS